MTGTVHHLIRAGRPWAVAALLLPALVATAPASAEGPRPTEPSAAAMNCFVNGVRQPGPEITGTGGDDDIACDVLDPGDVIHGLGGNDTIQVTDNNHGVVNGEGGADTLFLPTNRGLVQGGAGDDRIDVRTNTGPDGGAQGHIRGGDGDDTITVLQNAGLVEGNAGFDTCSVTTGNLPLCEA
ncbi:hypothetical protein IHE55_29745 [Streptomyces pactum]|uniref:Calcium-binding protein n=1 Tax=Streptomyces pactum TaxID=68249 RepID=A0ABS0NU60_9ACTN|nr:hypothetical protein [Streptomyces pactum]MBH5338736.1 hypothetical protein [Streptomyces pactum]